MNTKRIAWADIAKGIGILAIIAGHMGVVSVNSIVFTFHVPIFFLISGYFLSTKDTFKDFIVKKAKTLLIPYVFTCILQIIAQIIVDFATNNSESILSDAKERFIEALYGSGSSYVPTPFGIDQIGAIWFLLALFWSSLIVKFFITQKHSVIYIILIATISYITAIFFWLPFSLQPGGIGALFLYIGYYSRKINLNIQNINIPLMILGFLIWIIEAFFGFNLSMASNRYDGIILSMMGAVIISYFIICISVFLEKKSILRKTLSFWGQNSLIILCYHIVDIDNIPWNLAYNQFGTYGIPLYICHCIVYLLKILLMTLCTFITLKSKFLRKIFNK